MGLHDVAMNQAARDVGFMVKAPQKLGIAPPLLQDALDHTESFQAGRPRHGQKDLAHAALAERAQQNVGTEAHREFVHRSPG